MGDGKKPLVLVIMDGFGLRFWRRGNAIKLAKTPNIDKLFRKYPKSKLGASGEAVGLPKGFQGSSEVGHLTIGSGRIIYQDQVKINNSIENDEFFYNHSFLEAIKNAKKNKKNLHLMGLLQDQGVHAHQNHLFALVELCSRYEVTPYIHIISDGRDTPPKSVKKYIDELLKIIEKYPAKVASITGRYYAMDRDKRWDRTKLFYDLLIKEKSDKKKFKNIYEAVKQAYKDKEFDEFIKPRMTTDFTKVDKDDSLIFFNYRPDRARQITQSLIDPKFRGFNVVRRNINFVAMTRYYAEIDSPVAYERTNVKNVLARVLKDNKKTQLRIAETEKYAHVTYFFNDEIEKPYAGEDRVLIPSPKVATYDLKPEMSAYEITDSLLKEMNKQKHDLIVVNFANCDMVGHTGKIKPTIKAVETVDKCVGKVVSKTLNFGGSALIIADHGNAEMMIQKDGSPCTSHTLNKVPCCLVGTRYRKIRSGGLADVAPTLLKLLKIEQPKEMTGKSLI
ncbi:2,3-bisphosphoglycerate-independent phosphoglycerate mutase [Candidatus Woesearchaeota archaeon]|nr:MAG: 2,3-bisphosphoglycerate-independent phosphoglycerate mutase [Candidatus Woesearchaeota archaeon]